MVCGMNAKRPRLSLVVPIGVHGGTVVSPLFLTNQHRHAAVTCWWLAPSLQDLPRARGTGRQSHSKTTRLVFLGEWHRILVPSSLATVLYELGLSLCADRILSTAGKGTVRYTLCNCC